MKKITVNIQCQNAITETIGKRESPENDKILPQTGVSLINPGRNDIMPLDSY